MDENESKELRARRVAVLTGGGLLAVGVGLLWRRGATVKGADFQLAAALAARWAGFGVDPKDTLAIAGVESDYRPGLENTSERAMALGGAWGMMQVTLTTARDLATLMRGALAKARSGVPLTDADSALSKALRDNGSLAVGVEATLPKFDPQDGRTLLDPALNTMLGAYFLSRLAAEFNGNFATMAAAYHNGAGFVRNLLSKGGVIPDDMPPLGKEYVALALARKEQLADYNPGAA